MPLHDAVGINCKECTTLKIKPDIKYELRGVFNFDFIVLTATSESMPIIVAAPTQC